HWYGFWDYGDVMHSYDADRHVWRYDVGGYAWDNSELSTDLWLWYHYLRSGDASAFRFAEAMTRHPGAADTYHLGQCKGLGTRHDALRLPASGRPRSGGTGCATGRPRSLPLAPCWRWGPPGGSRSFTGRREHNWCSTRSRGGR